MRVTACERCSETLTAANDHDLVAIVRRHLEAEHGEADEQEVERAVRTAYDAMDS